MLRRLNHISLRARLIMALALFGVGALGQTVLARKVDTIRADYEAEINRPLTEFPERIGSWIGTDLKPDPQIIADIKIDQYLNRVYVHPSGEKLVLWMSYSKKSYDQYHYPVVCMVGSGWTEDESMRQDWMASDNSESSEPEMEWISNVPVMRMYFHRQQRRQIVYYWYYLIGEDPIDRVMREFSRYARAFLRGRRNASLTVEVFSQSKRPNRELLDQFVRDTAKTMDDWMPPGTEATCVLGATY